MCYVWFPYRFLLVMCSLWALWLWGLFFSMTVCAMHVCVCVCVCVCVFVRACVHVSVKGCVSSAKIMPFGLSLVDDKLYLCFHALSSPPHPPQFLSCLVWMHSHPNKSFQKLKHCQILAVQNTCNKKQKKQKNTCNWTLFMDITCQCRWNLHQLSRLVTSWITEWLNYSYWRCN